MTSSTTPRRALEAFLVDPSTGPLPPRPLLERTRLAAYAHSVLDPMHPDRAALLPELLTATTAHEAAVAVVAPLVRAWQASGIEVLAFKGFALALFTYQPPGLRFYEDVDLLMRPGDAAEAERIARGLGWGVPWSAARSGNDYAHELMHLASPDGRLQLDVHRLVLHSYAPWQRRVRLLTRAAWTASTVAPLGDAHVRVLDPRDAVLMGLVLNRAWSTDRWRLKPRDYVDFATLVERHGLTLDALRAHARELGCPRTLELFLARCDPFARHVDLRSPGRWRRWRWSLSVAGERRPYQVDHAANLLRIAPGALRDTLRELPGLLRVLWLLRRERDIGRMLRSLDAPPPAAPRVVSERRHYRVVRGVRWGLKLLRVRPEGDCVPRALAVFASLRRLGAPAVFVSGVRHSDAGLVGHAWVELGGEALPELGAPLHERYEPNVRYPASGWGQ
jgi:hypothetical protein